MPFALMCMVRPLCVGSISKRRPFRGCLKPVEGAIGHFHVLAGMNALVGLIAIPTWHVDGRARPFVCQNHGAYPAPHIRSGVRQDWVVHRLLLKPPSSE